ncbi:MAG: ABC transporter permease [Chloroflexi bacterium]|nr:ABC transporter permease [Chloroflexota bacterium]
MVRLLLRYACLALAVVVLNFLLPRVLPGDPLDTAAADGLGAATSTMTVEGRTRWRATYHLDQPLGAQLVAYLGDLSRGDLGWSISRDAPVGQLIGERLPWTIALVLTAVVIAAALGGVLGLLSAWHPGRIDRLLTTGSTLVAALPEFLVSMGLLLVLAIGLRWFPLQGGRSTFTDAGLGDVLWHLTLPAVTLILATTAGFMLLARGAVGALRDEPYLLAARGKGLGETAVAVRHAVPNALLPVLTLLAVRLGHVLGGALVVERVFALPGLGMLAFEAIRARDYPVLQAIFLLASLGVLGALLALELLYRRLSPRQVH